MVCLPEEIQALRDRMQAIEVAFALLDPNEGPQGPVGPMGPAGNVALNLAALKAASPGNVSLIFNGSIYKWEAGNYTEQDNDDDIIASSLVDYPISEGAWILKSPSLVQVDDAVEAAAAQVVLATGQVALATTQAGIAATQAGLAQALMGGKTIPDGSAVTPLSAPHQALIADGTFFILIAPAAAPYLGTLYQRVGVNGVSTGHQIPNYASILGVGSYAGPGGSGDRTALGWTASSGLVINGSASNLIDGVNAGNATDGISIAAGVDVTNKAVWTFIAPFGESVIFDQVTQKQSGTQTQGTCHYEVSRDYGVTWEQVGVNFTSGGSATSVENTLNGNTIECNGIRKWGETGLVAGSGWIQEVELRSRRGQKYKMNLVPGGQDIDLVLTGKSSVNGDSLWARPKSYGDTRQPNDYNEWFGWKTDGGEVVDRYRRNNLVFDGAGEYTKTKGGVFMKTGMLATAAALPAIQAVAFLMIGTREDAARVLASMGTNNVAGMFFRGDGTFHTTTPKENVYTGHGGESVAPLISNAANGAHKINRGGPILIFANLNAPQSHRFAAGGTAGLADLTTRASEATFVWGKTSTQPWTVQQMNEMRTGLRRAVYDQGIRFDWRDCATVIAGYFIDGDSNGQGQAPDTELKSPYLTRPKFFPRTQIMCDGRAEQTRHHRLQPFMLGANVVNSAFPSTIHGPETGMAFRYAERQFEDLPPIAIIKTTATSSYARAGGNLSWNAGDSKLTSRSAAALRNWWNAEQECFMRDQGLHGIGGIYSLGVNDCIQIVGDDPATDANVAAYGANMQAIWNEKKAGINSAGLKAVLQSVEAPTGSPHTPTRLASIRSQQVTLVGNNADMFFMNNSAATAIDPGTGRPVGYRDWRDNINNKPVHYESEFYIGQGVASLDLMPPRWI